MSENVTSQKSRPQTTTCSPRAHKSALVNALKYAQFSSAANSHS
ncbi:Uncharacterised protein [Vibrio cholerae]|nr:Uncharacterised protein [Vibrio cholerae]